MLPLLGPFIWTSIGSAMTFKLMSWANPEIMKDTKEELKKKGEQAFEDLCERVDKHYGKK
jgi:hypothetical protein